MGKEFSKDRIRAEMREAQSKACACLILCIFLSVWAIFFTLATSFNLSETGDRETALQCFILAIALWIATGGLVYGTIHYDHEYKRWKSML